MSSIEALRDVSASLNRVSEQINEILENAEEDLRSMNLGIEAWTEEPIETSPNDEKSYYAWFLGWCHFSPKWRLAVQKTLIHEGVIEGKPYKKKVVLEAISLSTRSRELRAKAVGRLEDLYKVLHKEAESTLQNTITQAKLKLK